MSNCPTPTNFEERFTVNLLENAVAITAEGERGFWTMVDDQGLELVVGGQKLFHFFSYSLNQNGTSTSFCSQSLTNFAWFHSVPVPGHAPVNWGCFRASQHNKTGSSSPVAPRLMRLPSSSSPASVLGRPLAPLRYRNRARAVVDNRPDNVKYAGLPEAFDWRNVSNTTFVGSMRDQLTCGSCYAFAGASMLESRIRIVRPDLNKLNLMLSPQAIVSCSAYSQGCDGGFPYLVAKFAEDFSLCSDPCFPYESGIVLPELTPVCAKQCADASVHYRATNYRYVGGFYGNCSEVEMMRELVNSGPLAVGIAVPESFLEYRKGIYIEDKDALHPLKNGRPFEPTAHAVVVTGYGVEDGVKYWMVKNSWGRHFGETGYVRVRRGTDEIAIESAAVATDVAVLSTPHSLALMPAQ